MTVWLSQVGLGLLAVPLEILRPAPNPVGIINGVQGGAQSQGWYMQLRLGGPGVVNLGNLNATWRRGAPGEPDLLGVRVGNLNTTVPLECPGSGVLIQLDAQAGDYGIGTSRVGGQSDTVAARIDYRCGAR